MENLVLHLDRVIANTKKARLQSSLVMVDFMDTVADAFGSYDDRKHHSYLGLNAVAAEFKITALKA